MRSGALLARMPIGEAGGPVGVGGEEIPVFELVRGGGGRRGDDTGRSGLGPGRGQVFGQGSIEGAIDLEGGSGAGPHLLGRDEGVAVVEGQAVAQGGVGSAPVRLVVAGGVDARCADLVRY